MAKNAVISGRSVSLRNSTGLSTHGIVPARHGTDLCKTIVFCNAGAELVRSNKYSSQFLNEVQR